MARREKEREEMLSKRRTSVVFRESLTGYVIGIERRSESAFHVTHIEIVDGERGLKKKGTTIVHSH